ncbi:MAG TPA: hypothetical protein VFY29_15460, partial [Terriglobia bacterium]|nr:hypothetical protein [Terriglobia bacterium]
MTYNRPAMRSQDKGQPTPTKLENLPVEIQKEQSYLLDIVIVRSIFALTLTLTALYIEPFGLQGLWAVALGFGCALGI